MKRYHYIPGHKAPENSRIPKWAIPAGLMSVVFGIIALTIVSGAAPLHSSRQEVRNKNDGEGVRAELELTKSSQASGAYRRTFTYCATDRRETCVIDGDTFWLDGVKIRMADIDTPEITQPKCAAEKALGDRATQRLMALLSEGEFQLASIGNRDVDQYGRKLRIVLRGGKALGDQLVIEGLARKWTGRREPWC